MQSSSSISNDLIIDVFLEKIGIYKDKDDHHISRLFLLIRLGK